MRPELVATATRRSSPASADSVSRRRVSPLAEPSARQRSRRSLGTCCLDPLNPHQPLTSVVTARSSLAACPGSSRQPLLAPRGRTRRCRPARRLEAMPSRTSLTVEDTLFPLPVGSGDLVSRRPSSCRSRVALSRARAVLSSPRRGPLSYDPVLRLRCAPGARFELFALDLARPPSTSFEKGARQARSRSPHGGSAAPFARLSVPSSRPPSFGIGGRR